MVLVLVHGGAANIPKDQHKEKMQACIDAARNGIHQLLQAGNAVDAVTMAVTTMENNPTLNAGYGSSLTIEGTVENDAIVMDGQTMNLGAVTCVTRIQNPVQLARLIMERSDHCVLAGEGAHEFAKQNQMNLIENETLVHENAKNRLAKCGSFASCIKNSMCNEVGNDFVGLKNGLGNKMATHLNGFRNPIAVNSHSDHDTVGAVALDADGHLACATSTGGLTGKAVGRIGDSPLAGCGGWAEDNVGAFSSTGHGEQIMRVALCKHIAMLSQTTDLSLEDAVNQGLEYMKQRVGGAAGVIAVGPQGQVVTRHSTPHMVWAYADSEQGMITYGIDQNNVFNQPLNP